MKCEECVKAGKKSIVQETDYERVHFVGPHSYWDEEGRPHNHPWSARYTVFGCSNGHEWRELHRALYECETCGHVDANGLKVADYDPRVREIGTSSSHKGAWIGILGSLFVIALVLILTAF